MNTITVVGIYLPFFIATVVVFGLELFRRHKRSEDYYFIFLCFFVLGWFVANIVGLLTSDVELAKFCIRFMLFFVALIPPTLLLFVLQFFKVVKLNRWFVAALYIIPVITLIVGLTDKGLLYKELELLSVAPIREYLIVWGPWFWVHTVYSYIVSIVLIVVILASHFHTKRFYRLPSSLMIIGVLITLVGNLITLFRVVSPAIEITLITISLAVICFDLAIINNDGSKFMHFSRSQIYNFLAELILVLNEDGQIIDFNHAASDWFSQQGIPLITSNWEVVSQKLQELSLDVIPNEDDSIDICLPESGFNMVLNQQIYQMQDIRKENLGSIVMFRDVTKNRLLIEHLESKAGIDPLTGLPNRMAYEGAKARLDSSEYLPLSVVMCDANNLKLTNDMLGHEYGDMLLRNIADVLEKASSKEGFLARIGGDEFILLLPCTAQENAKQLTAEIERDLKKRTDLPFELSLALGAATKTEQGQNLDEIIRLADTRMYEHKKKIKKSSLPRDLPPKR